MHGYLRIFVLRELVKKERTGYELMKSFEDFTGNKPSPGTIYPLLSELLKKGMVTVSAKGNKKIYRLSKNGESILHRLKTERKKALENIISMLSTIYSKKEINRIRMSLSVMSGEKGHFAKDFDVLSGMREAVFDFVNSKQYPKEREKFRKILQNTSKKLRKLVK